MNSLIATLASSPVAGPFAAGPLASGWGWFQPGAATHVDNVDWLFWFITWVSVFFFVLIAVLGTMFVVKYRHRPGHRAEHSPHHNNTLEVVWSVIPLLIVVVIFFYGFTGYVDSRTAPDNAYVIDVQAYKWGWAFKYDNGAFTDSNLHVPVDRPVKLVMSSKDVLHSLYIPAFRVKMDCVPGKYTEMWFRATQASRDDNEDGELAYFGEGEPVAMPTGDFDLFCTEYCGTGHSSMYAKVVVHEAGGFEKFLKDGRDPRTQGTAVEVGEKLYSKSGCAQCHSIDGSDRAGNGGPSFKGHYGKMQAFEDGNEYMMDENYIRESILNPMAKIRKGYQRIMPSYQGQLSDDQIYAMIQYIKSLNDEEPADWLPLEGEEGEAGEPADRESADGESAESSSDEPKDDEIADSEKVEGAGAESAEDAGDGEESGDSDGE